MVSAPISTYQNIIVLLSEALSITQGLNSAIWHQVSSIIRHHHLQNVRPSLGWERDYR